MVAPAPDTKLECPHCKRVYQGHEVMCALCSQVLIPGLTTQQAEQIHRELGEANLKRMRGDLVGAKEACISVLKVLPSNVGAHLMLAEICEQLHKDEQALDWYQLALDLDPTLPLLARKNVIKKIESLKQSLADAETAEKKRSLQLPSSIAPKFVSGGVLAVSVLVVGILAFIAGQKTDTESIKRFLIKDRVIAPKLPAGATTHDPIQTPIDPEVRPETKRESSNQVVKAKDSPAEDQALATLLSEKSPLAGHIVSVLSNPRNSSVILTFSVATGEPGKKIGVDLAAIAFEVAPNLQLVTLRGVRDGKLSYVSDIGRAKWEEASTPEWKAAHSEPQAFYQFIMSNEWFAAGSSNGVDSGDSSNPQR